MRGCPVSFIILGLYSLSNATSGQQPPLLALLASTQPLFAVNAVHWCQANGRTTREPFS